MARYRVGEGGIRVTTSGGAVYSLPPGAVLDEIPQRYEGKLIVEELDEAPPLKAVHGYANKMLHPVEDKAR